jgi:hypothetical protein
MMPNADYIEAQSEITWQMRETLVDWLLQVHLRYHMLPETLWIAVNLVDRFLSKRVVSVAKLQLVGVTAMFVASKYEEILAPSVDEFVFLCENGYSREEILKGEGIILQTLDFAVSQYCSPYSWMRRISKADDYDIQTRTLAKFITELTLLDHRFLAVKPSLVAAVGMYSARRMLGGDWVTTFLAILRSLALTPFAEHWLHLPLGHHRGGGAPGAPAHRGQALRGRDRGDGRVQEVRAQEVPQGVSVRRRLGAHARGRRR